MTIINATHVNWPGRGRVYASPQFVQSGGVWGRIADTITVRADAKLPGFVISYKDSSITLSIVSAQAKAFKLLASKYQTNWDHFAVSVNDKVPNELQWEIKVVGKVSKKEDHWKFDELEGCDVGLSLADWQNLFGDKMSIDGDIVTMDMTDFKKDMTGDKVLDPSTVDLVSVRFLTKANSLSWADVRGGENTLSNVSELAGPSLFAVSKFDDPVFRIVRSFMQFDTSSVDAFVDAALFISQSGSTNLSLGHISRLFFTGSPAATSIYGKMFTAYTDRPIGFLQARSGVRFSVNITKELEASSTFRLSIAHQYDVLDLGVAATPIATLIMNATGDNAPFIEYTTTHPRFRRESLETRDWLTGVSQL